MRAENETLRAERQLDACEAGVSSSVTLRLASSCHCKKANNVGLFARHKAAWPTCLCRRVVSSARSQRGLQHQIVLWLIRRVCDVANVQRCKLLQGKGYRRLL